MGAGRFAGDAAPSATAEPPFSLPLPLLVGVVVVTIGRGGLASSSDGDKESQAFGVRFLRGFGSGENAGDMSRSFFSAAPLASEGCFCGCSAKASPSM